jgi:hypothetical protein
MLPFMPKSPKWALISNTPSQIQAFLIACNGPSVVLLIRFVHTLQFHDHGL